MCWAFCASATGVFAQDLLSRAAAARDSGDVPAALSLYRQVVREKPESVEGWLSLGLMAYQSGQFADGRQAFTELTRLSPQVPLGWAFLGLCEFETGDYPTALGHLDQALAPAARLNPTVRQVARFHRALLLTRAGAFDRGREELTALVRSGTRDPELILGLGLNALEIRALPSQVSAAQRDLVEMAGNTAHAWATGDPTQTETNIRSLLANYPRAPGVHYLYATYLLSTQPEAAIRELRRELEVNPGNAEARATLALRLIATGSPAAALPLAAKAAADAPDSAVAHYAYGLALTGARAWSDAIRHFKIAIRIDSNNLSYHIALATAFSEAGLYAEALSERQTSINLAKVPRGKS
jgi:tetratricopeptide (TPR) repeat protein